MKKSVKEATDIAPEGEVAQSEEILSEEPTATEEAPEGEVEPPQPNVNYIKNV